MSGVGESKNLNRVAGGYKATMHNPNTSEEAKQSAKERLEDIEPELEDHSAAGETAGKNLGNVIGGHKANLSNPKTSQEAKEHSRRVLDEVQDEGGLDDAEYTPEREE